MKYRWIAGAMLIGAVFAGLPGRAQTGEVPELAVSPLFGSHAVLQNGMPVPVWGSAAPGSAVTVSFAGQTVETAAGNDGRWTAVLQPLAVSSDPQKMVIESDSGEIVLNDVLVGEVWLVCGRSNIGFILGGMTNAEQERQAADQPQLRLLRVATKDPSDVPLDMFQTKGWQESSPASAGGFSAVGWVFGSELQKARGVPVGIVMSSWGGSPASMWIEKAFLDWKKKGGSSATKEQLEFERESQRYHQATDGQTAEKVANKPGTCFNSHIHPLIPMAMKGSVIFFDGELADNIRLLAENWRDLWDAGDFPFIFIQVHRQGGPVEEDPNQPHNSARAEYIPLLKQIPNSAMVVALDTGVDGPKNIHPPNKRPVGERAALAARGLAYGEPVVYSGPVFSSVQMEKNRAVISFDCAESGLEARGGSPEGFAVTGDGRNWVWGEAEIEGNQVIVSAPEVKVIQAVRYAWGPNNPKGNLYNKEGLPASPFSSR